MTHTIGLIGYGFIGANVAKQLAANHPNVTVAWVMDTNPAAIADLPAEQQRTHLIDADISAVDLVVETAHASVVQQLGERILTQTHFLPISLSALADEQLFEGLLRTAETHHTRLFIPHGAALGLDTLFDSRHDWQHVTVTTRKHPANLNGVSSDAHEEVLYEGTARGACAAFPRNVNTHAAVALAGLGFDRTESKIISDPNCNGTEFSVQATANDTTLALARSSAMQGVSSATMPMSVTTSILAALRGNELAFC